MAFRTGSSAGPVSVVGRESLLAVLVHTKSHGDRVFLARNNQEA